MGGEVGGVVVLRLDRHGRSHNITAECCVGSSGKKGVEGDDEDDGLASRLAKGGVRWRVWMWSRGSCLMV